MNRSSLINIIGARYILLCPTTRIQLYDMYLFSSLTKVLSQNSSVYIILHDKVKDLGIGVTCPT
jgi:hypothetical protein